MKNATKAVCYHAIRNIRLDLLAICDRLEVSTPDMETLEFVKKRMLNIDKSVTVLGNICQGVRIGDK